MFDVLPDKSLDCVGLFCPMPIAQARLELERMQPGEVLEVLADDPGFLKDLPAFCKMTGTELISLEQSGRLIKGLVKKA